jgi:hypothetical protein
MKLIHLNVESFKYFDALVDFLEVEKPDILSLVEASDGCFFGSEGGQQRDYIWELCAKFKWNAVFHPTIFRDFWSHKVSLGAAVLSSHNVSVIGMDTLGDWPSIWPHDHIVFSDKPKYERYPYAWKLNMPLLITEIHTENWPLKLLTAHFHVSYECLETLQIWQDAEKIVDYLNTHEDNMPTILTGDLNIRNESMAIKTLSEKLTQQSGSFINTLCRSIHPTFFDKPWHQWLWIDHIFTKNISVSSCEVREVEVSDHLPLVLDFSL